MNPRRALLFMPGDDRHKIEKGVALGVDGVIMDLEDGVALNRKESARETVAAALREVDFGTRERLVRINPIVVDGLYEADIAAIAPLKPDGLVIPKVESAQQIHIAARQIAEIESEQGWPIGTIRLLPIIESALGVVNLREIVGSDNRLSALVFGAEDLAGDIGARRTPDGWEVFYARSAVVIHARAMGLQALDTIYPYLDNVNGLESETEQALYMGFTGKLAIHPRQVEPIQRVFTPTPSDIQQAQRLITAFEEHQAAGTGVFVRNGKMVDMPMIQAARIVLNRARIAGLNIDT